MNLLSSQSLLIWRRTRSTLRLATCLLPLCLGVIFLTATAAPLLADSSPLSSAQAVTPTTTEPTPASSATSNWLPTWLDPYQNEMFLGIALWQWLGLVALLFIAVCLDYLVRFLLRPLTRQFILRYIGQPDDRQIRRSMRPIGLLAGAIFFLLQLHWLTLTGQSSTVIVVATKVILILASLWSAWSFIDLISQALLLQAAKTETKLDDILVPLVRKTAKILTIIVGVIYGADALNVEIAPLLTGLGIGGLAFAFAAKDTIENFFGSFAVLLDRPFSVGDWVVVDQIEGTVEELGFRSTRIRTFYNSLVTVPNATLVRAQVDNYGQRKYRRYKTTIGLEYSTSPDKILAFTEGLRELIRKHPFTRKDYYHIYFHTFNASSLDILVYIFFNVPDWGVELRERERLNLDIIRLADQLDVQFAFPTQTLHIQSDANAEASSPSFQPPQSGDQSQAMALGRQTAQTLIAEQDWQTHQPGAIHYDDTAKASSNDRPIENRQEGN